MAGADPCGVCNAAPASRADVNERVYPLCRCYVDPTLKALEDIATMPRCRSVPEPTTSRSAPRSRVERAAAPETAAAVAAGRARSRHRYRLVRRNVGHQPPICEFEVRFHLAPAAMRLPHHGVKRGIGKDEPGLSLDASLRGHCRIARWMKFRLACQGVRVPLRARSKRP